MADYDIHINGGTIVDGTRVPRYRGDLWIKDGTHRPDRRSGRRRVADRVIDADGHDRRARLRRPAHPLRRPDPLGPVVHDLRLARRHVRRARQLRLRLRARCKPDFRERSMLTMVRTEAIPYESMVEGMLPNWDWETIPEYLDSLDRAPQGRQLHPVHADGVADDLRDGPRGGQDPPGHRRRSARRCSACCTRAWTPACAGSPSSASGPNSVQADFDGTPMVTDTMCRRGHPRPRPRCSPSATRASSRSPRRPATSRPTSRSSRSWPRWPSGPILHNVVAPARNDPEVAPPVRCAGSTSAGSKGLPIYAQCGTGRAGFAFTLEHWNLYDASPGVARRHHRHQGGEDGEDARSRAARGASSTRPRRPTGGCRSSRPASAATRPSLVVQGVNRQAGPAAVRRPLASATSPRTRASTPIEVMLDLSLAGDLNVEFLGPDKGSNAEFMAEMMNDSPYTHPRRVRRRRPHQVLHRWRLHAPTSSRWLVRDEGVVTLEEAHYRLSALAAHAAGFQRPRRAARGRRGRRRRLRHRGARHRPARGSARSSTTCPAASGAGCSGPRATSRSSSTAR